MHYVINGATLDRSLSIIYIIHSYTWLRQYDMVR